MPELNAEQKLAVEHTTGPLLVVAGAGTGKTQVITHRIAHLIESNAAKPSEILALTFTDKAAQEMESRVGELLNKYVFDVNITTFNAYGDDLLRRHAYDIKLSNNIKLMSNIQQVIFMQEHLDDLDLKYYSPITNPEAMLGELVKYFSKLKNQLITPPNYLEFAQKLARKATDAADSLEAERHQELATAYATYCRLTRAANMIDLDDQVYLSVELLESRPNVLKSLQKTIRYILVDEFQDTNAMQSRFVDLLAGTAANLMVVGDDDQSIYQFRGAAISNILQFKERYPQARQLALIQNYRSSQEILDAAYRLIQNNNPDRLEAKYGISKQLRAQFSNVSPHFQAFASHEEEAHWLARDIKGRLESGTLASEIAVLVRKNAQVAVLKRYLETEGIPYQVLGQSRDLYQQPEVKTLVNILQYLVNPRDSESLYHVLVSEWVGLDATALRTYTALARSEHRSLEVVLQEASEQTEQLQPFEGFLKLLNEWRQDLSKVSVGKLAYRFLDDTGYLRRLLQTAAEDPAIDTKITSLNRFFTTLLEFERVAKDTSAVGYINNLPALIGAGERLPDVEGADPLEQKVAVLTIHKAKGLEFEVVYLFDLTQGTFPSRHRADALELPLQLLETADSGDVHLHEERRLMYVAMTRAKKDLILTYASDHGGKLQRKPSIFLEEALGRLPALDSLPRLGRPDTQIHLFKMRPPATATLPPNLLQGETVVLTYGQIDTYLMCPAEFRFRYILSPPLLVTFSLQYGTLLHAVIQHYNRLKQAKQPVSPKDLSRYLKDHWPREGFASVGHQERSLEHALTTLERFYAREEALKRHPSLVEKAFTLELAEQKVRVNGRFDAVYEDKQGVEIRDYKTGAYTVTTQDKANRRSKDSLQLGVYALAWQRLQGDLPAHLSLDFIDVGFLGVSQRTARQLDNVVKKIVQVATGIREADFSPSSSHLFCTHVGYDL